MIFFKKNNWNRFFTHKKITTIRFHKIREGLHSAGSGSRISGSYKHLGKVIVGKAVEPDGKMVKDLTEQDAIDDGFDNLAELIKELKSINFTVPVTPETIGWRYPVHVVEGNPV
jgi:hypothetical protein